MTSPELTDSIHALLLNSPPEIWLYFLSFLTPSTKVCLALTCRQFYHLTLDSCQISKLQQLAPRRTPRNKPNATLPDYCRLIYVLRTWMPLRYTFCHGRACRKYLSGAIMWRHGKHTLCDECMIARLQQLHYNAQIWNRTERNQGYLSPDQRKKRGRYQKLLVVLKEQRPRVEEQLARVELFFNASAAQDLTRKHPLSSAVYLWLLNPEEYQADMMHIQMRELGCRQRL